MIVAACIETSIECSRCNVLRRVHAGLDVDAGCAMHLLVYLGCGAMRVFDVFDIVGDVSAKHSGFTGVIESCAKEGAKVETFTHLRAGLHIHLLEDF